jgi:hypothetical protein
VARGARSRVPRPPPRQESCRRLTTWTLERVERAKRAGLPRDQSPWTSQLMSVCRRKTLNGALRAVASGQWPRLPFEYLPRVPRDPVGVDVGKTGLGSVDRNPMKASSRSTNRSPPYANVETTSRRSGVNPMAPRSKALWWTVHRATPLSRVEGPAASCQWMCAASRPIDVWPTRTSQPHIEHLHSYAVITFSRNSASRTG